MCLLSSSKWSSTVSSIRIVQWDFTRRDHPRNPGRVSGSGPVRNHISKGKGEIKKRIININMLIISIMILSFNNMEYHILIFILKTIFTE